MSIFSGEPFIYGQYYNGERDERSNYIQAAINLEERRAWIYRIVVSPEMLGSGLAPGLIEAFEIAAREKGVDIIEGLFCPESGCDPERVRSFYEKMGYEIINRKPKGYPDAQYTVDYIYKKLQ